MADVSPSTPAPARADRIVILGGGHAGVQVAAALRQEGHSGPLTIVDDEGVTPYQRPPLSKAYMQGTTGVQGLLFRPAQYYADHGIELLFAKADAIDRAARQLHLPGGRRLDYDHLIIATGARNRPLPFPGADTPGVRGLRTLADADVLSERLKQAKSVVVIGAGFIGLEFAAVAQAAGAQVQVVELASRVMGRAVTPQMSAFFHRTLAGWGIEFHMERSVKRIVADDKGQLSGVELSDGRTLPADLVVYGIGVLPNVELAAAAGLQCDNGVRVDTQLLTSDPAISAIGDCASFPDARGGGFIRLESVQNAADQSRSVAARLMGKPSAYHALPWFWTEQGSLRLQIAGLADGHDATLTLGDETANKFSVLCFKQGRLVAVESVNTPADHMVSRRILAREQRPTMDEVRAPGFELKAWDTAHRASPPAAVA
ncbi:MAG: FAD-dependent oxidoreductase [Burkholderiaceae bacterium]|nr:FAD-dependent oxidoreductase [Burkholderiaceae bacterium]